MQMNAGEAGLKPAVRECFKGRCGVGAVPKQPEMAGRVEGANRVPLINLQKIFNCYALNSLPLIPQDREHSKSHPNPNYNFLIISLMKLKDAG
jgi:hypothetical protein